MHDYRKEVVRQDTLINSTAQIVAAYLATNHVDADQIFQLIDHTYSALERTGRKRTHSADSAGNESFNIKDTITPDYLVCLEDGKRLKMLKRHLRTNFNLTPQEYRAKWGLSPDYPMVAPNYAAHRSLVAKNMGLGRN